MTSKKFILNKIEELIGNFPQLTIRYEYDDIEDSHFIEISPLKEFETNEGYISAEKKINLEFIKNFPFEILTFVSTKDNVVLESPLVFQGETLSVFHSWNKLNYDAIIASLFDDYEVDWKDNLNFVTNSLKVCHDINIFEKISSKNFKISKEKKIQTPEIFTPQEVILSSDDCGSTSNDYLLAA